MLMKALKEDLRLPAAPVTPPDPGKPARPPGAREGFDPLRARPFSVKSDNIHKAAHTP